MIDWKGTGDLERSIALERYLAEAQAEGISEETAYAMLDTVTAEGEYTTVRGILREAKSRLVPGTLGQAWAHLGASEYPIPLQIGEKVMPRVIRSPLPGDLVLVKIKGVVGKFVWLLQALNGDLSKWTHVVVMLDGWKVWECQPGGSVFTSWSEYEDREFAIVKYHQVPANHDGGPHRWNLAPLDLTEEQRTRIVQAARDLGLGIGYGWTTYLYLAAYRVGIRPKWLKDRVQNAEHLICSQGGDEVYNIADVHLFNDGRMPYDVTPGDLGRLT